MKEEWQKLSIELGNKFPKVLRYEREDPKSPPKITQAIDAFVEDALRDLDTTKLLYDPCRIEDLQRLLSLRLDRCAALREQAYRLDQESFREVLDVEYRTKTIAAGEAQLAWSRENEATLLKNQRGTKTDAEGRTTGDEASPVDWAGFFRAQETQVAAMKQELDAKISRLSDRDSPGSFVARHEMIVRQFSIDVREAYLIALALKVGLVDLFFIIDSEDARFPRIDDPKFLDGLIFWYKTMESQIQRLSERIRFGSVVIPFHQNDESAGQRLMAKQSWLSQLPNSYFIFNIDYAFLKQFRIPESALLQGVDIWLDDTDSGNANQFPSSTLLLNASARLPSGENVILPPSKTIASLDPNISPAGLKKGFNTSPFGEWTIQIQARGARGEAAQAVLKNMFLRLHLAWQDLKR